MMRPGGGLLRLFSMPGTERGDYGHRGREWVLGHFNSATVIEQTLRLYGEIAASTKTPGPAEIK